jgi:hypothetical protein
MSKKSRSKFNKFFVECEDLETNDDIKLGIHIDDKRHLFLFSPFK